VDFDPTRGYPGEGPAQADFRIVTINSSTFASFRRNALPHFRQDVIFAQETKNVHQTGEDSPQAIAKQQMKKQGYRTLFETARATAKNSKSSGVMIAWRASRHAHIIGTVVPHRATGIILECANAGSITMISFYGDSASEASTKQHIETVLRKVALIGKPWIIAGDFNMSPQKVQSIVSNMNSPSHVVTSGTPTCKAPGGAFGVS
jgi:exonuclease III